MDDLTFWSWECPECEHVNARQDDDLQRRGWIGTVQCSGCLRRFELIQLYKQGYAIENEVSK